MTEYGPSAGALQGAAQNRDYGQGQQAAINRVATLAAALNSIAELNKRLIGIVQQSHGLATMIGGLFPMGDPPRPSAKNGPGKPESAMDRLNQETDAAHRRVSDIETCLTSIGRSLGGQ